MTLTSTSAFIKNNIIQGQQLISFNDLKELELSMRFLASDDNLSPSMWYAEV